MRAYVGITDRDWYRFLRDRPELPEVNFWQPGGGRGFRALALGEPFLFKLHAPQNYIVGGGFFAHFSRLPVSMAWKTFGEMNGAGTYLEMRRRIEKHRPEESQPFEDYEIGCIILAEPFFLPEDRWIPAPDDFSLAVQTGKTYDLAGVTGRALWHSVLAARVPVLERVAEVPGPVFGTPTLTVPRLGQGAFRVMVTDAYGRRCAITGEKALPALQAAHIRPVSQGGVHRVDNGLLLRSDVHGLFDAGYITVTPKLEVRVSRRLKEDFDNGEPYLPYNEKPLARPGRQFALPAKEFLEWHGDAVFRG